MVALTMMTREAPFLAMGELSPIDKARTVQANERGWYAPGARHVVDAPQG